MIVYLSPVNRDRSAIDLDLVVVRKLRAFRRLMNDGLSGRHAIASIFQQFNKALALEGHAPSWPQLPRESDATAPRDSRGRERAERRSCDERSLARAPPLLQQPRPNKPDSPVTRQ